MVTVYPVVIYPQNGEKYRLVYIPDFDNSTQGRDLSDCIEMARDCISLLSVTYQDNGKPLPDVSDISELIADYPGCIVTLVDADIDAYRKKLKGLSVRRNVSLPAWLDDKAKEANINVSSVLQDALKAALGVK